MARSPPASINAWVTGDRMDPPIPPAPLMMPDTAAAFFSPRIGVTAPMMMPKAIAPVPPPTRMPKDRSRTPADRQSGVSRKPDRSIRAPMIRTMELLFFRASAPKKGCAKP